MTSRGPYRRDSTPFKLQLCQDIRNGVIGQRDAQRTYGVSANLIQLWLTQFDRGELNDEEAEASVIAEYEAHIAALERKVGQLTMELDLVKKQRARRSPATAGAHPSSPVPGLLFQTGVQNDRSPQEHLLLPIDGKSFKSQRQSSLQSSRISRMSCLAMDIDASRTSSRGEVTSSTTSGSPASCGPMASGSSLASGMFARRIATTIRQSTQTSMQRDPGANRYGLGGRLHVHPHCRRLLLCRHSRRMQQESRRLWPVETPGYAAGAGRTTFGHRKQKASAWPHSQHGPRMPRRIQPVVATLGYCPDFRYSFKASVGVFQARVFRGLLFRVCATA
jgi:transposase